MLQNDYNDKKLSNNLFELIREAGHNTTSFADAASLPESTVRNLCDDSTAFNPNAKTLVKLSDALNASICDILQR